MSDGNPLAGPVHEDEPSVAISVIDGESPERDRDVTASPRQQLDPPSPQLRPTSATEEVTAAAVSSSSRRRSSQQRRKGHRKGPLIRCQELIERAAAASVAAASGGDEEDLAASRLRTLVLDDVSDIAEFFEPSSSSAGADSSALFDLTSMSAQQQQQHHHHHDRSTSLLHIAVRHGSVRPDLVEELVALGAAAPLAWERDGADGSTPLQLSLRYAPHLTLLLLEFSTAPSVSAARHFLHDVLRRNSNINTIEEEEDDEEAALLQSAFGRDALAATRLQVVRALLQQSGGGILDSDGAGETALEVLADNSTSSFTRGEMNQLFDLLVVSPSSSSPANSTTANIVVPSQSSSSSRLFFHPCLRILAVLLLISNHIAIFSIDFYNRSSGSSRSSNSSFEFASVGNKTASGPGHDFIFRVVDILGTEWPSALDSPGLFSARLLCIVLGAAIGMLFFAFAVQHLLLRALLQLRMFGADTVYSEPPELAQMMMMMGGKQKKQERQTAAVQRVMSVINGKHHHDAAGGGDVDFLPDAVYHPFADASSSREETFTRRSLTRAAETASSPAFAAEVERRVTERIAAESPRAANNDDADDDVDQQDDRLEKLESQVQDDVSGETELRDAYIAGRGRFALVLPLGIWVGIYCGALVFAEINEATSTSSSSNITTSSITPTFSFAAEQFFHANLAIMVLVLLLIFDSMFQCLGAATAWRQVQLGAYFPSSSRALRRFARWWAGSNNSGGGGARLVASPVLHIILLGLLAVYHYFSIVDGFEIPLMFEPDDHDPMLAVLVCLSCFSVLLIVVVLLQEWSLPNMQLIEVVKSQKQHQQQQPILLRHALFLPLLSGVRGNPCACFFSLMITELVIDLIKLSIHIDAAISFLEMSSNISTVFIVVFVVALVLLLTAVLLFLFRFLLRSSTRFSAAPPSGIITSPASSGFAQALVARMQQQRDSLVFRNRRQQQQQQQQQQQYASLTTPSPPSAVSISAEPSRPSPLPQQEHVEDKLDQMLRDQRGYVLKHHAPPPPPSSRHSPPAEQERNEQQHHDEEDSAVDAPKKKLTFHLPATEERIDEQHQQHLQQQHQWEEEEGEAQEAKQQRRAREGQIRQRRLLLLAARQGVNVWSAALNNAQARELQQALSVAPDLVDCIGGPGLRVSVCDEPVHVWEHRQQQIQNNGDRNRLSQRLAYYDVSLVLDDFGEGEAADDELRTKSETPATLLEQFGASLLHYAVYANSPACVEVLLEFGADVWDTRTRSGALSAIDLAKVMGREKLKQQMIEFARGRKK